MTPNPIEEDWTNQPAKELRRNSDPKTSKASAELTAPITAKLDREVLGYTLLYPGYTANELTKELGFRDPRHIGRRLPILERNGFVERREDGAPCLVTGRQAARWWATVKGAEAAK
jgi:hypothetical protein